MNVINLSKMNLAIIVCITLFIPQVLCTKSSSCIFGCCSSEEKDLLKVKKSKSVDEELESLFTSLYKQNYKDYENMLSGKINDRQHGFPLLYLTNKMYSLYKFDFDNFVIQPYEMVKDTFIECLLKNQIFRSALKYLADKNLMPNECHRQKEVIQRLWFTIIRGGFNDKERNAFQRIILQEPKFYQDKYFKERKLIVYDNPKIKMTMKRYNITRFQDIADGVKALMAIEINRPMLVGISPELEMALVTVCYFVRPFKECQLSFGDEKLVYFVKSSETYSDRVIYDGYPALIYKT